MVTEIVLMLWVRVSLGRLGLKDLERGRLRGVVVSIVVAPTLRAIAQILAPRVTVKEVSRMLEEKEEKEVRQETVRVSSRGIAVFVGPGGTRPVSAQKEAKAIAN